MATVRCAELAASQLRALEGDQAFVQLQQEAAAQLSPSFAARAAGLVDSCVVGDGLCQALSCTLLLV